MDLQDVFVSTVSFLEEVATVDVWSKSHYGTSEDFCRDNIWSEDADDAERISPAKPIVATLPISYKI